MVVDGWFFREKIPPGSSFFLFHFKLLTRCAVSVVVGSSSSSSSSSREIMQLNDANREVLIVSACRTPIGEIYLYIYIYRTVEPLIRLFIFFKYYFSAVRKLVPRVYRFSAFQLPAGRGDNTVIVTPFFHFLTHNFFFFYIFLRVNE